MQICPLTKMRFCFILFRQGGQVLMKTFANASSPQQTREIFYRNKFEHNVPFNCNENVTLV